MTRPGRAPCLLLLAAALACRPASREELPAPAPGTSLFQLLERLEVARFPDSNVPEPARAAAAEALAARAAAVRPEDWMRAGEAPRDPGESLWKARPRLRLDLELGRPWLTHEGRACEPFNRTPRRDNRPTHVSGWKDPAGDLVLGWSRGEGRLVATARERPGEVRFGWELDEAHDGAALEPVLTHGKRPADARALQRTLVLEQVSRPVLVVGTPSRLEARVALEAVDELRLGVARWDVGFELREEQLVRAPSPSDGLEFRVRIEGELVWSLAVADANVVHEVSIDLARFRGRTVTLALETEPGPRGDATSDYGLWSGLGFHGEPRAAPARPHIVLVDVDTLRADRLGCYGYARDTSPRIDRWAREEAVLYEDALAAANWTLPSTVSILTGLAPSQHTVLTSRTVMGPALEPIALRLRAAGYETYARTDGAIVSAAFGFGHGFDSFAGRARPREEHEREGWRADLERIRERRSERPLFCFLQTYQVHEPYVLDRRYEDPGRPYGGQFAERNPTQLDFDAGLALDADDWRWLGDSYDAGVRRMDDVVGAFLEGLAEAFGAEPYLVIVTSDHGDEIGEHGRFGHGHSLHEELLRVPLLVRFPGGPAGVREPRPVSSLDLVPTMLDVAGLEAPPHLPGRSLRRPLPEQRLRVAVHKGTAFATYLDGWKLLSGSLAGEEGAPPRLVRHREDPREERDLLAEARERAAELERLLQDYLARHPAREGGRTTLDGLSAPLLEELRQLGYAGDE